MNPKHRYTAYWPKWMCDRAHEAGLAGTPLRFLIGGWNRETDYLRYRFGVDDEVLIVSCAEGLLYLIGRMRVAFKGTVAEWLALHPEDEVGLERTRRGMTHEGHQLVVGDSGTPIRFDCAMPPSGLKDWRFLNADGKTERALKGLKDDSRLRRSTAVQGVFRITAATATAVDRVLAGRFEGEHAERVAHVSKLELKLLESPNDEGLASVLADALLELGDPRGEVIALDLALAAKPSKRLQARLDKVTSANLIRLIGRPGGFPFRVGWTPRSRV